MMLKYITCIKYEIPYIGNNCLSSFYCRCSRFHFVAFKWKMNQQDYTAFVFPFLRLLLLKKYVNIISLACPWEYYDQDCASKCR